MMKVGNENIELKVKSSRIPKQNILEREDPLHKALTFITTLLVFALPFLILMKLFCRVKIYDKNQVLNAQLPFLFVSNHTSMLDDAFLGPLLFLPRGLWDYKFIPYHTPERKNFYRGPFFSWIMEHAKCLPLTRGQGIHQPGIQRVIDKLKAGNCVHIYPEGTRTRTGKIGPGKPGVGRIVYETKCKVIPCYHSGLNEVLPIGRKIPRPGKKVRIIIGEAISLDHYFQRPNNLETWQAISDEIIAEIKRLKAKIE